VGKLRDYAKRSTSRSQYRGGGRRSARTQHKTQHGPPRADSKTDGCAEPSAHPPPRKSTPHYTIGYSTPAVRGRGLYTTVRAGVGLWRAWGGGPMGVGRERSMHKEALGDFNQALATRGQTGGGAGQWPSQRRNGTWQNEGTEAWGVWGPCAGALIRG